LTHNLLFICHPNKITNEGTLINKNRITLTISILLILTATFSTLKNATAANTIKVPNEYSTIQQAINAAAPGDTILVAKGYYYGHVVVNKTLTLLGEDPQTTVIEYFENDTVYVRASNVYISGFTIKNCRIYYGIWVEPIWSTGITIKNNIIVNGSVGVGIQFSTNTVVEENIITKSDYGIRLYRCSSNTFAMNTIINNTFNGIHVLSSTDNYFYKNNIINNPEQAYQDPTSNNHWDDGVEGNYWSDYTGQDLNGDGIGDTLLPHQGLDYKPLMTPWGNNKVYNVQVMEIAYKIRISSNSSIGSLLYNGQAKRLDFNVTGALFKTGFCNVTIPKQLLYGEPWQVSVDSSLLSYVVSENITHTSLNIRYYHYNEKTLTVTITGTRACVIPGDVNADGIVNIGDATLIGWSWQSTTTDPTYNWQADVNVDGVVNVEDATTVGFHWLQTNT
jgi:parallel beta-helix repeat protein